MIFQSIFKRNKKNNVKSKNKPWISDWMELTKEERLELDFREKNESMKKKKALLKTIREEYNKIKNKKK